jgi:hypothetical protein
MEPLITLPINSSQSVPFYEEFLIMNGAHINYKDIQGISHLLTNNKYSFNFIPTVSISSFSIKLVANGQTYQIGSSAAAPMFFQGSRKQVADRYAMMVYVLHQVIGPYVIVNLLTNYSKGKQLKLGDSLSITPHGLYRSRLMGDPEHVEWHNYACSVFSEGKLWIFKFNSARQNKPYFNCLLSVMNAVVMPEVLGVIAAGDGKVVLNSES